jgi:hypothetical protein
MSDGVIEITGGAPCDPSDDDASADVASSAFSMLGSMSPLIMAHAGFISPLAAVTTYLIMGSTLAKADGHTSTGPITIEIYTDVDAIIHEDTKSMTCPPESFHYEHHPSVHGGYAGCVGEKYLLPCGQVCRYLILGFSLPVGNFKLILLFIFFNTNRMLKVPMIPHSMERPRLTGMGRSALKLVTLTRIVHSGFSGAILLIRTSF